MINWKYVQTPWGVHLVPSDSQGGVCTSHIPSIECPCIPWTELDELPSMTMINHLPLPSDWFA